MDELVFNSTTFMLILPVVIIQLILMVVALIDWMRTEKTNGSKWLWLFVILLLSLIGPILYFIIGRRD